MNTSAKGVSFIAGHEGFRARAYQDTGGKWTIGFGHLIKSNEQYLMHAELTRAEAEALMAQDLREHEGYVKAYMPGPWSQSQFDALTSLMYNRGPGRLQADGLYRLMNGKPTRAEVEAAFRAQNTDAKKVIQPGLVRRREEELAIFFDDDYNYALKKKSLPSVSASASPQ